jgi:histidinol-phosphate aminotransferase
MQVIDRTAPGQAPPARLVYLSNPHSPTAHVLPATDWPQAQIVIVDEAYGPFLAEPATWPLYPNVIRVQSPGKAHGLLGLRLAYALARPALAAHLDNLQPAWAIPGPVAEVLAELPGQTWFLQETLGQVRAWAAELAEALDARPTGLHFFSISVNDAPGLAVALLNRGIRLRDCTSFGLPGRLRIAAQRPEQNHQLVQIWQDVRGLHLP